ncbi:alkaline phosphatase PhoX [Trujillonella endophytica]|uniref:Tat (Twin-arginine translocation) pathway signal sequence n=1 Tax=Trujillonella endophytica TaxID=673521 RepID=A0A1H8T636_9ACTN|nr:alkaline phosphatase PhoX [Trujillella endophytica]SEO85943.1 hypothetical protein SAMN05660991_02068 [Trujillella endophytica]
MSRSSDATGPALSRRSFLAGAAAGAGVLLVGCGASRDPGRAATSSAATGEAATGGAAAPGYGPLVEDPRGLLALPAGFRYRVLAREGETRLDTGEPAPSDPDGAAAFAASDGEGTVLVVNHEVGGDEPHPVPHVAGLVYDEAAYGGTTTMLLGPDGEVRSHTVSLAGTRTNCAGGRTPWETWLSCEETEEILGKPHGYVFEVDPFDPAANRDPRPVAALGRFAHEAVVVDPEADVLYLTEDAVEPNGSLYRWVAPADARPLGRGSLRRLAPDAGVLEALRATTDDGRHVPDLSAATEPGTAYRVEWVPVPDRDAVTTPVRRQLADDRITRAHKLEGAWWADGGAYVVSSYARADDGSATEHDGQVWFLDPRAGTLTLRLRFARAVDADAPGEGPDNITLSPHGGVLIAEDGLGAVHLLGATEAGEVYPLARCDVAGERTEFCGPVFAPDGRALFANVQGPGCTFLVEGPFDRLA